MVCLLFIAVSFSVRFSTLNNRLKVYRRGYVLQRREISYLKKYIQRLKRKIHKIDRALKSQEDFLFGPILTGFL